MFIGHLPAGYLLTRTLWRGTPRAVMIAGLIGAVLPDVDLLWFYLVDSGQVHHHTYLTHRPAVWAAVLLAGVILQMRLVTVVGAAGLLHMMLDSIVGAIAWGWPFTHATMPLVVVPATHDYWVKSFLTHWTFQVEIILTLFAIFIALRANFFATATNTTTPNRS